MMDSLPGMAKPFVVFFRPAMPKLLAPELRPHPLKGLPWFPPSRTKSIPLGPGESTTVRGSLLLLILGAGGAVARCAGAPGDGVGVLGMAVLPFRKTLE